MEITREAERLFGVRMKGVARKYCRLIAWEEGSYVSKISILRSKYSTEFHFV